LLRTFSENIDLRIFLVISLAQKLQQNPGKEEENLINAFASELQIPQRHKI